MITACNSKKSWFNALSVSLVALAIGICSSFVAEANASNSHCKALVEIDSDLYLASPSGEVLTRFTSDAEPKRLAAISPRADKAAYIAENRPEMFATVNSRGETEFFPIVPRNQRQENMDSSGTNNRLLDLSWNSANLLRLTHFAGRDSAQFDFRRVSEGSTTSGLKMQALVIGQNCAMKPGSGLVACIDQGGHISLGDAFNGQSVYSVPIFQGGSPLATLDVNVGEKRLPQSGPPYTLRVKNISNDQITLDLTRVGSKFEKEAYVKSGAFTTVTGYESGSVYGYFATILNRKAQTVRVKIVKSEAPDKIVDMGLAWQPHGEGLLFIRHKQTQSFLYLIQPGRKSVLGHNDIKVDRHWHLAAKATVNLPGSVKKMRFLTGSMLLLDTGNYKGAQFSILPVHISNGRNGGTPLLHVGDLTRLPSSLQVSVSGTLVNGKVLDWSCPATRNKAH